MSDITPADIVMLRSSFEAVKDAPRPFADVFYDRLFETLPEVRPMFHADLAAQKQKFIGTLAIIVGSLEKPDVLLPAAEVLAKRHVAYGVEPLHYVKVGAVLLDTLGDSLGDGWTEDVSAAWAKAYGLLSTHMIATAYRS